MYACVCVHFELNAGSSTIQTKTQTWRRQWVGKAFCLFNLTSVCGRDSQREQCKKEVRPNGSCDCSSCVIDNETQTESINSNACQTQLCLHTAVKQYIGPKPAAQLRCSLACRTINKATVAEKSEQKTWHANASANANLRFCGQNGERNVWSQCTVWLMMPFSLSITLLLPHTTQHLQNDSRTYRYEAVIDDSLLPFYRTVTPSH